MARVKVDGIVNHLDREFRTALRDAVRRQCPDATIDEYALYREFKRAVNRKCNTWERVPDQYID